MKPQNFLSFNEKTIYFKEVGNEYWIAIKPICEALNVDYIRAYKNISEDENLSQLLSKQTIVGVKIGKKWGRVLSKQTIHGGQNR